MAQGKAEFEKLQVLLLPVYVPCPSSVARQAPHASASTGSLAAKSCLRSLKAANGPLPYEVRSPQVVSCVHLRRAVPLQQATVHAAK